MKQMIVKGKVEYVDLSGGFWGLIDQNGQQWRPVHMPAALQHQGLEVQLSCKQSKETISIFMWGTNHRNKRLQNTDSTTIFLYKKDPSS